MLGYLNVLIGGGLLLAGRKLFWLLVGAVGFMLGLELASRIAFRSQWMLVLAALVLGVAFALLAVFVETVAIGVAGFLGGGLGLMRLVVLLGIDSPVGPDDCFHHRRRSGRGFGRLALQLGADRHFVCGRSIHGERGPGFDAAAQRPLVFLRSVLRGRPGAVAGHAPRACSAC